MTHPNLDELVRQARRDRPALSLLTAVARSLGVAFLAAPLRAIVAKREPVALPSVDERPVKY